MSRHAVRASLYAVKSHFLGRRSGRRNILIGGRCPEPNSLSINPSISQRQNGLAGLGTILLVLLFRIRQIWSIFQSPYRRREDVREKNGPSLHRQAQADGSIKGAFPIAGLRGPSG